MKMTSDNKMQMLQTTLGDLVVTVTDIALELSKDTKKAYLVAAIVLHDLLSQTRPKDGFRARRSKLRSNLV